MQHPPIWRQIKNLWYKITLPERYQVRSDSERLSIYHFKFIAIQEAKNWAIATSASWEVYDIKLKETVFKTK